MRQTCSVYRVATAHLRELHIQPLFLITYFSNHLKLGTIQKLKIYPVKTAVIRLKFGETWLDLRL